MYVDVNKNIGLHDFTLEKKVTFPCESDIFCPMYVNAYTESTYVVHSMST